MKTDVWMPLYIAEYLADTMHLSTAEHGAYLLLIMAYWRRKGPLPDDDRELAAVARASQDEWFEMRARLAKFFQVEGGCWRHKRIERELSRAIEMAENKSRVGKLAANARWNAGGIPDASRMDAGGNANAMPERCQSDAPSPSPSPVPSHVPVQSEHIEARTRAVFVKPTMEEVKLHAAKAGMPASEAERFFNYYESNGWRVGRNPMKSWQAAMVNWKKNWEERRGPQIPEANQTQETLEIPRL